jgi:AraC-like DNA-binding protein
LYYLREGFPIARIAEMLGFADASVLSRSCYRWFSDSPTELRKRLKGSAAAPPRPKDLPSYSWRIILE